VDFYDDKMELEILEDKKNKLVVEIKGEDHTFCNALKAELWNDKHVKIASYNIQHPLISEPRIIVETDGSETPQDALKGAAKRLGKLAGKFKELYSKEVK
jgi:DNA-directed RNA polymerase subunit L